MSSSKSKLLRLVLCIEILLLATAYAGDRGRYCGPRLTEMLQILCKNKYASLRYNSEKRSDNNEDDAYMNDEPISYNALFAYHPNPYTTSFGGSATSLGPHVRREYWNVKRGVFDDCCSKPCSIQDLMSYCGV